MSTTMENGDIKSFSGAESFLVGLSPQYWAHTPLAIGDVCNLGVVDGIDCIISKTTQSDYQAIATNDASELNKRRKLMHNDHESSQVLFKFLPVSKCRIEGVVVNVELKSNGSVLYLIDDGTGFMDCIAWSDDDLYSLPPLVEPPPDQIAKTEFRVGDVVRVMGKIRCMSVGAVRETVLVAGKHYEVRDAIRELQATIMEHATDRERRPKTLNLNSESKHWLDCLQFLRRAGKPAPRNESAVTDDNAVYNGAEILGLLGPEILASVEEQSDFPGADDSVGAWRVFGMNCQCNFPYKESLLYCHCQAKTVALDPELVFRDAVLESLLSMECDCYESEEGLVDSQLRFQYKTLVNDQHVASVAQKVVAASVNPSAQVQRLYLSTFGALRADGIVYLENCNTDTYLLVSRKRVLEPYVKKISSKDASMALERRILRSQPPPYLAKVPKARLQFIKKCLLETADETS